VSWIRNGRGSALAALLLVAGSIEAAPTDDGRFAVRHGKVVLVPDGAPGGRFAITAAQAVATTEPRRGGGLTLESSAVVAASCDAEPEELVFQDGFE